MRCTRAVAKFTRSSINIDCIEPRITRISRIVIVGRARRPAVLKIGNRERLPYKYLRYPRFKCFKNSTNETAI
jgi:hypothetical protein